MPRLLYGRSEHVDVLIESGVARQFRVGGVSEMCIEEWHAKLN